MFYSEELVEEVRMKNDIRDVVSGYVKLQKKGSNHWGCCPFHNEKTPSFSVSGQKQMYYCFGCHATGNVYTFLMKYENYTFPEAIRALADRAGVKLPEVEESPEMKRRADKRMRLLEVNKEAAKFFYYQLRSPNGATGFQYLKKENSLTKPFINLDWVMRVKMVQCWYSTCGRKNLQTKKLRKPDWRIFQNGWVWSVSFGIE